MQVPPLPGVTSAPATVQLPAAVKLTGSPEDADAPTANGGSPNVRSGRGAKAMVWLDQPMVKLRMTLAAGS